MASWAVAVPVPSVGDAMTVLGATTNAAMGFLLPVIYYLKVEEGSGGPWRRDKAIAKAMFVLIIIFSIIELYCFVYKYVAT